MTIIPREIEIQEKLSTIFDELVDQKEHIRCQLARSRQLYKQVCDEHIFSGFSTEVAWLEATQQHQQKFLEYDAHCYILDILTDYRNMEGYFPEYIDMLANLENIMLRFAREERYEVSAIIKPWLQKLIKSL
ncbi:hypothetical protein [Sphingobacterium griseoflavum]|uniref:Uncharacterized protein n=1 Tax=Sphingobacterium griseoflavum TaxID=1474952 RepID=A0ABQ3HS89_9SPHI|nr:hypothetical protein [Sphingobacterium griseoflavum]GHE23084.1 hypothetical protein GCM10017764_00520 [Sphingobacterium griseoflavum]